MALPLHLVYSLVVLYGCIVILAGGMAINNNLMCLLLKRIARRQEQEWIEREWLSDTDSELEHATPTQATVFDPELESGPVSESTIWYHT